MLTERQKELVEDNLNLPHYVLARRNIKPKDNIYEDILQECMEALCKCAVNFDPSMGVKFVTYAYKFVDGVIIRYLETHKTGSVAIRRNVKENTFDVLQAISYDAIDPITDEPILASIAWKHNPYRYVDHIVDCEAAFHKADSKYGEAIFILRKQGYPVRDIEKIIGVSKSKVNNIVRIAYKIYKEEFNGPDENKNI